MKAIVEKLEQIIKLAEEAKEEFAKKESEIGRDDFISVRARLASFICSAESIKSDIGY
jgi:hypothetical protein